MKEGYIKRKTSTIPFGYEVDAEVEGYLPILFSRKMIYLK